MRKTSGLPMIVGSPWNRRASSVAFPPGETSFSVSRIRRFASDSLSVLLESYERFGPVFTLRLGNLKVVFMLGAEATHFVTVSNASNFTWSHSLLREYILVFGEGLFLTDGDAHDRPRRIMLPAFQRNHITASVDVMVEETERALDIVAAGSTIDLYAWNRKLTMRILMRALLGLDPDSDRTRSLEIVRILDQVEAFHRNLALRLLRGPFTPWARLKRAMSQLDSLISSEISRRRATGERGSDVLSLLLDGEGEDGRTLSDLDIRDHMKTLIFAGQDSTVSTFAFMFYEIARHPDIAARLLAEQSEQLGDRRPTASQLVAGELPFLEMVVDETLRRYAPPWLGPRRSREAFEFAGHTVPADAHVAYSMWATHHLPDLFPDPFEFRPERFSAEARAALPKGAYAPFGGGPRTCVGMRFAQTQIRTVATVLMSRFTLSPPDDFQLQLNHMPTVSPTGGMPMIVSERPSVRVLEPA